MTKNNGKCYIEYMQKVYIIQYRTYKKTDGKAETPVHEIIWGNKIFSVETNAPDGLLQVVKKLQAEIDKKDGRNRWKKN